MQNPIKSAAPPTTSRVVMPMTLRESYTPIFFRISTAIGTVELTGLEIMCSWACGGSRARHQRPLPHGHRAADCKRHNYYYYCCCY